MPPLLVKLAFPRLFLQAAEVTKLAAEAAGAVGGHTSKDPVQAILWLAIIALAFITFWQWRKAETATTARHAAETSAEANKAAAVKAALTEARSEWAKELAIDNGNAVALQAQMREQFEKQITQLRDEKKDMAQQLVEVNKELRQQIGNDARVLEATANSLRSTAKTGQAINANQAEILRVLSLIAPPSANVRPAILGELL